jgi:hypothetical protein
MDCSESSERRDTTGEAPASVKVRKSPSVAQKWRQVCFFDSCTTVSPPALAKGATARKKMSY